MFMANFNTASKCFLRYESYMFLNESLSFTREFIGKGNKIMNNHIKPNSEAEINIGARTRKMILQKSDPADYTPFLFEIAAAEIIRLLLRRKKFSAYKKRVSSHPKLNK